MTGWGNPSPSETHAGGDRRDALGVGRGLAIVFVMYGHSLAPWVIEADDHFSEAAFLQWKLGASFLMVFFFFMSGLAWRETTSLKATLRQTIGLILIAWSGSMFLETMRLFFTWGGIGQSFGQDPISFWHYLKSGARLFLFGDHYTMATMWFLTALGLARLIAAVTVRLGIWATALAMAVLLVLGFLTTALGWRNFFQIAELGVAFAAFIGGRAARPLLQAFERNLGLASAVLIVSAIATVATYTLNQGCPFDYTSTCPMPWMSGHFSVTMSWGVFGYVPLFLFTAIAGMMWLIAGAVVLARWGGKVAWRLSVWGRNTVALLAVNGAYLEWVHPLIARWIAPRVPADNPLFFLTLFVFTLAVNFTLAALLHRPLKAWLALAMKLAGQAVDAPRWLGPTLLGRRRDRVSEVRE